MVGVTAGNGISIAGSSKAPVVHAAGLNFAYKLIGGPSLTRTTPSWSEQRPEARLALVNCSDASILRVTFVELLISFGAANCSVGVNVDSPAANPPKCWWNFYHAGTTQAASSPTMTCLIAGVPDGERTFFLLDSSSGTCQWGSQAPGLARMLMVEEL